MPQNYCFEKVTIEEEKNSIEQLISNIIYNILIVWIFMILLICFVICNVLGHFYRFSDFKLFNIVKNAYL